ncbi:MAG: RagB/SusD family nutrient uptake outer membrane protein [Clostridium sp.]|nr:RagB/SusD family nutrient uptake outer membrane protein [Clostridium sp.]
MKNISKYINGSLVMVAAGALSSCGDSFLEPEPLSFYEPTATFQTVAGLESALSQCDSQLKFMYVDGNGNVLTTNSPYLSTDIFLYAKTDAGGAIQDDIANKLTPTTGLNGGGDSDARGFYWNRSWDGIKYANTVLTFIDDVKGLDDATRDEYRGRALFHRSYHYYNLALMFSDIPLVTELPTVAKNNYSSTSKDAVMRMLVHDLEIAVKGVKPQKQQKMWGVVNQEACMHLLTKCYLAIGEFKKAEDMATDLINNHGLALMTEPFGTFYQGNEKTWKVTENVMWDLMRGENVVNGANTETIMPILNYSDQQFTQYMSMRSNFMHWSNGIIKDPDGVGGPGQNYARNNGNYNEELDWLRAIGRGIGCGRTSKYYNLPLWTYDDEIDWQDLRHNREVGNWVEPTDIKYNNPSSKYYGQNYRLWVTEDDVNNDGEAHKLEAGTLLCTDTIRSWYPTPLWKLYILDQSAEENMGATQFNGATKGSKPSNGNLYLFRLAETYLLRAEAKFYQGNATGAAQDVNVVRARAKAKKMFSTVTIGDILDERARELYMEEFRQGEMVRISWCLARSGQPDEFGNTYDINTWDKQQGTDLKGGSYWYQRCVQYNLFNHGPIVSGATLNYQIDKKNLFWPIPNSAITANYKGQLRQNYGYTGYDDSIPMFDNWEEAVEDEHKM